VQKKPIERPAKLKAIAAVSNDSSVISLLTIVSPTSSKEVSVIGLLLSSPLKAFLPAARLIHVKRPSEQSEQCEGVILERVVSRPDSPAEIAALAAVVRQNRSALSHRYLGNSGPPRTSDHSREQFVKARLYVPGGSRKDAARRRRSTICQIVNYRAASGLA
jgi:hypothetical protein